MMKKEYRMLEEKQKFVSIRKDMVTKACNTLLSNNMDIFKTTLKDVREAIFELTNIPIKTLERSPYKDIINNYRSKLKDDESGEVKILKKEIEYKNKLIDKLRRQNRSLETQLFMGERI